MKQGWEIKKLGEIICEHSVRNKQDYDYPVYSVTNSAGFCRDYFSKEVASKDKKTYKIVPKGYFAYNPSRINVGSVDWQRHEDNVIVSPLYVVFGTDDTICQDYLLYYLKSSSTMALIQNHATGTVRANLKFDILSQFAISLPPISEQEKIVAELDCLSGIIEKKKQQLKELDNLAQSIFYEMFGDPVENDKGWEVREVGDVCILKSGDSSANNTSAGMLPYIKVGDMNMEGNNPRITTSSTFVSKEENAKGIFPIGSILFPKRGGAIFTNKKRLTSVEVCCDLNIMGVIPKREVLPIYIYHYFIGLDFGKLCNGATIPQINNKDIAPLKICVPSKNKQQEFASMIESIEKQKELIAQSIKETETLFNSRMDYYFN